MAIVIRSTTNDQTIAPSTFETEAKLQELLAQASDLLRQDGDPPVALVGREVDLREAGALDLLFVNADGLPIAVEVKLERNAQARREVVAQVIDYLSALTALTVDELEERVGGSLEEALRSFSAEEDDVAFDRRWRAVGANLRAGLARMVVALDAAPAGLERILRFLARNSALDVQLVVVQRFKADGVGDVCVPDFRVSAASDETRPESSLTRTPLPGLIAAVEAYNASADPTLRAGGIAANYRAIHPPEWPGGFRTHYEFYQTKNVLGAELHIEADSARPLGKDLAAFAGRLVASGRVPLVWDVRLTENADTGGSPWWISAGSLVPGAVPDADRVVWPVIANGPRIKKGTVFCSTEQGIRQAANLMAQGDTTNLDARTPFFCANIARDDSVIEVVVRTEGIIAYKGYPRGVGSLMWVRDSDVLGLGPSAAHPPASDSLTLVSFDVIFEKKDPGSGVFASAAVVRLTIKNNTATAVAAWRATLIVTDPFGDELFQTQLTDGRANVPPGMIADASFRFEDNPFINNEPYDKLLAYDPKKLTLRLSDVRLVH